MRPLRTHLTPGTGLPVILQRSVALVPGLPTTVGSITSTSGLQAKSWELTRAHICPVILSGSWHTVSPGSVSRFFLTTRSRNFLSLQSHVQGLLCSDRYWKIRLVRLALKSFRLTFRCNLKQQICPRHSQKCSCLSEARWIKVTFSFIKFSFKRFSSTQFFIFICTRLAGPSFLHCYLGPLSQVKPWHYPRQIRAGAVTGARQRRKCFLFSSNLIKLFPHVKHGRFTQNIRLNKLSKIRINRKERKF